VQQHASVPADVVENGSGWSTVPLPVGFGPRRQRTVTCWIELLRPLRAGLTVALVWGDPRILW
jgi:hypothetical protein